MDKKRFSARISGSGLEVENLLQIDQHDPTFDAVSRLEKLEREEVFWDNEHNHRVVSSCTTLNWDAFPFAYDQLRARINEEKRENYRWARGWVLPGRPDTRVLPDIACDFCGLMFRPASRRDKFCSHKCSAARFVKTTPCKTCGQPFKQMDRSSRRGYCSAKCGILGRTKIKIEFRGEARTLVEWSAVTGISPKELRRRKEVGWDVERMLTTPVKVYKKRAVAA